jgi:hypothetical protein
MKVVQYGQKGILSSMTWKQPILHGQCTVLKTKTVEVKALGKPPQLRFFLPRKPRRPLLVTILRHEPAGPWRPPWERFIPVAGMNPQSTMELDKWIGGRKVMEEAARNQGLPYTLIDDIYPKNGQININALKKKYTKWPVVGTIKLHVALQQSRGQTNLVLLSGPKKTPIIVATAGKPVDSDMYTAPPALVWTAGSTKHRGILNLGLGQRGLPRNCLEAKKLFQLLELDTGLVDTILA